MNSRINILLNVAIITLLFCSGCDRVTTSLVHVQVLPGNELKTYRVLATRETVETELHTYLERNNYRKLEKTGNWLDFTHGVQITIIDLSQHAVELRINALGNGRQRKAVIVAEQEILALLSKSPRFQATEFLAPTYKKFNFQNDLNLDERK